MSAVRLLTGTYAFCGKYWVDSNVEHGTQVTFFPWEVALGFSDEVMYVVIRIAIPESMKLTWVRSRDETTRADMAQVINESWPGGEGLLKARESLAHYWRMEDKTIAHTSQERVQESQHRGVKREHHERESKGSRWPANSQRSGDKQSKNNPFGRSSFRHHRQAKGETLWPMEFA